MSTFWKIFAIFWIIFLVWYLTGGPQRVTNGEIVPAKAFDSSEVGAITTSSIKENQDTSNSQTQTQTKSDKSFSDKAKTNTINVNN